MRHKGWCLLLACLLGSAGCKSLAEYGTVSGDQGDAGDGSAQLEAGALGDAQTDARRVDAATPDGDAGPPMPDAVVVIEGGSPDSSSADGAADGLAPPPDASTDTLPPGPDGTVLTLVTTSFGSADAGFDPIVEVQAGATDVSWHFGDNQVASTTANPTHTYTLSGNKIVYVISPDGPSVITDLLFDNDDVVEFFANDWSRFSALEEIDLQTNHLQGAIPATLQSLTSLRILGMDYNQLTGPLPSWLNLMPTLEKIDLDHNQLAGTIPDLSNLTALYELDVANNQLTGSFPQSVMNLASLEKLEIGNNQLTGPLPRNYQGIPNLTVFDVGGNALHAPGAGFTGPIPTGLGDLLLLEELDLEDNLLTGPIPQSLANLTRLVRLELDGNPINDAYPASLCNFQLLRDLDLDSMGLTNIPCTQGDLPALEELDLHDNPGLKVSGTFIASLQKLKRIDIHGTANVAPPENRDISTLLPQSQFLTAIIAYTADLVGTIPDSRGLVALEELDLHDNRIAGYTPYALRGLVNVQTVDVSQNQLDKAALVRLIDDLYQTNHTSPLPRYLDVSDNPGVIATGDDACDIQIQGLRGRGWLVTAPSCP